MAGRIGTRHAFDMTIWFNSGVREDVVWANLTNAARAPKKSVKA
jgi:hypothetical protein